jgi:hypothetical protein
MSQIPRPKGEGAAKRQEGHHITNKLAYICLQGIARTDG